jgi:hypothetical protein
MIIHYHNRSKLSEEKEQGAVYHDSLKVFSQFQMYYQSAVQLQKKL